MASCLTRSSIDHLTRREALLNVLASVPDPRDPRGRRYALPAVLALVITATVAGCRSFAATGQWAAHLGHEQLASFGLPQGAVPDESTLRKLFARLDADTLDRALGAWMWTRTTVVDGRRVIALDGKTVRGARTRGGGKAPHLIAAFDHEAGAVLGQVAVDAKSNEIPAARTLLGMLDLNGAVTTLDAMHTQADTASLITDAGGDYVFTVKLNMRTLYGQLKQLPWKDVPAHRHTTRGRGQQVTRTIKVVDVPNWVHFPSAALVAQLRRTVTRKGKTTVEVVYLITSADRHDASPQTLAAWVRGHWAIENKLHYVRDMAWDEDRSQVRTGHAPRVMATCRNAALSLLRLTGWDNVTAALLHHAWHPDEAVKLALTC